MLPVTNVRLSPGSSQSFSSCDLRDLLTILIPSRKFSQGNIAFHFLIVFMLGTFFPTCSSFFTLIYLLQLISSCKESELKVILTSDKIILFIIYRRFCVYRQTHITFLHISDEHKVLYSNNKMFVLHYVFISDIHI